MKDVLPGWPGFLCPLFSSMFLWYSVWSSSPEIKDFAKSSAILNNKNSLCKLDLSLAQSLPPLCKNPASHVQVFSPKGKSKKVPAYPGQALILGWPLTEWQHHRISFQPWFLGKHRHAWLLNVNQRRSTSIWIASGMNETFTQYQHNKFSFLFKNASMDFRKEFVVWSLMLMKILNTLFLTKNEARFW